MGQNGGKRPGAGRKPGIANRLHKEMAREVVLSGITPAEFLDDKMHNSTDERIQVEAAKALMTYVHKKQPEAREHTVILPEAVRIVFTD